MNRREREPWVAALLRWFDRNAEPMPWRRRPTPYRVWVSEIMLQQTQVQTVIPYFDRFIRRFSSLRSLAQADLHDVLKRWEGLGYYSRARNLHRAARLVLSDYGGRMPRNADALRQLPGIGAYTAAAVASIAFRQAVPVYDGNVRRVMARLLARDDLPGETLDYLQDHIPAARPGDFNQALMELGRLVCTPRKPDCAHCPLRCACRALKAGKTDAFPARVALKAIPCYDVVACVMKKNGRILIARRKPDRMLGGLWEFPGGKREPGETLEQTARREIREELALDVEPQETLCVVKHAFSHFKIVLYAMRCRVTGGRLEMRVHDAVRWVKLAELQDFPFPAADRRIIQTLDL